MNSTESDEVGSVYLIEEQRVAFKNLAGFQKHHRVPSSASDSDRRFLFTLAESEIDEDLQEVFSALRKAYGLKRKEIAVDGPDEGGGSIATPYFHYVVQVDLDFESPSQCVWRRSIAEINEPARIFAGPFDQVFGNRFSQLEVKMKRPLDLEAIVDHIEDAEIDEVKLDYDKDLTWCEIQMIDLMASVILHDEVIRVASVNESSPQQLLGMFLEVQTRFMESLDLANVPFLSAQ